MHNGIGIVFAQYRFLGMIGDRKIVWNLPILAMPWAVSYIQEVARCAGTGHQEGLFMDVSSAGWGKLLEEWPWFSGHGGYPIQAYSEFMPPPRLGQTPFGARDAIFADDDPHGWRVSEIEEEYEIRPGLELVAREVMDRAVRLGKGLNVYHLAGHSNANLAGNPCWPPELAARAGHLDHERYVLLLPLALSRTQDDKGRVRWTLFGGSEQGPERAFWKSFFTAPGQEQPAAQAQTFFRQILAAVYGENPAAPSGLQSAGFRIMPSLPDPQFPYWNADPLPSWTRAHLVDDQSDFGNVRYLLTFRPFGQLPPQVRKRYLAGTLHLLPFPGSLVFWGAPTYRQLQKTLPLAMQIPLLRLVARHAAPFSLRVPQSGWIHEPHPDLDPAAIQRELIEDTYRRSNRWDRVHRHQDPLALVQRPDKIVKVLFSTESDAIGLYGIPADSLTGFADYQVDTQNMVLCILVNNGNDEYSIKFLNYLLTHLK